MCWKGVDGGLIGKRLRGAQDRSRHAQTTYIVVAPAAVLQARRRNLVEVVDVVDVHHCARPISGEAAHLCIEPKECVAFGMSGDDSIGVCARSSLFARTSLRYWHHSASTPQPETAFGLIISQ